MYTYATTKVGPDLDNQAHVVGVSGLDSVDEDARLSARRVVHAHNAGTEILLHLGKVLVHLSIAVGGVSAVAVLQRVGETQEAIVGRLRAPPLAEGSAGSNKVTRQSGIANRETAACWRWWRWWWWRRGSSSASTADAADAREGIRAVVVGTASRALAVALP